MIISNQIALISWEVIMLVSFTVFAVNRII